jgi:arylsulfatase A
MHAVFAGVVLCGVLCGVCDAADVPARPNIVLLLADDLGWADLACYGNTYNQTPSLDRLAREGMRFTQFYAGPVCSPTRANIQSGQNQARFGITQHIPGHKRPFAKLADPVVPLQLPLEVVTYAEVLRDAGYATGYFGKWHLGNTGYGPGDQGWQTVLETNGNVVPQAVAKSNPPLRAAPFLAGKAIEFLETHREEPFVMQVSYGAVHIPLSTTPDLLSKYKARPPMPGYPSRPEYAGLLEELDTSVGQIVATIDRLGLAERTLVLFVSDNGGLESEQGGTIVTSNDPLRGEKGSLYEGGIRVPCIARLPGVIPAGSESDRVATTTDFHATFLDVAKQAAPSGQPADGVSLAPLLRDPAADLGRDTIYWHLPHYHHSTPASAMRRGDWKLIEFFEDGSLELYNLSDDLGETRNLAASEPDRARSMHAALQAWRTEVGARMPVPNPNYDPAKATQLGGGRKRQAE